MNKNVMTIVGIVVVVVAGVGLFLVFGLNRIRPESQATDAAGGIPVAQSLEGESAAPVEVAPQISPVEQAQAISPVSTPTPEPPQAEGAAAGESMAPLPGTDNLVAEAKRQLTQAEGVQVNEADIQLIAMDSREWADSSLGCPQPDMVYAQVITPGYLITLEANGSRYDFHTDAQNMVVPCFEQADKRAAQQSDQPSQIGTKPNLAPDAILNFRREGGIAGRSEEWTIFADGRVVGPDGATSQKSAQEVDQLLAEIETAGFFTMKSSYIPLNTCCDRMTYQLTVRGQDGRLATVSTIDAAEDTPAELQTVLDKVTTLLVGQN